MFVTAYVYERHAIKPDSPGMVISPPNLGTSTSPAVAETKLSDLEFADDIATLNNTLDGCSVLCQRIADTAAQHGLLFNLYKTKYMVSNHTRPMRYSYTVTINGTHLKEVPDFKYPGVYIATTAHDISVRKALAWKAMDSLYVFWKYDLPTNTKIKIFRTGIEPVYSMGLKPGHLKSP